MEAVSLDGHRADQNGPGAPINSLGNRLSEADNGLGLLIGERRVVHYRSVTLNPPPRPTLRASTVIQQGP